MAVLWGASLFVLLQAALAMAADSLLPGLRYPEYGRKLALLKRLYAECGGQPALVALGTSRTAFGFSPAAGGDSARNDAGWQFNLALTGQGPIQELVCLHRLLAEGIRPRRLLIEIHPPLLHQNFPFFEPGLSDVARLTWADLGVVARYADGPRQLYLDWFRSRCLPWHAHRRHILGSLAPCLLTELERTDLNLTRQTDAWGWSQFPVRPTDEANRRAMEEWSTGLYVEYLREFAISAAPRRAIIELLDLCRREQIEPALLLMPECERFRQGYPAQALTMLERWLDELEREHGVAVFNCREWCSDDQFCDGHHMLPEGAQRFSARLEASALRPWLASKPPRRTAMKNHSTSRGRN
ncbi:MAG TPA: hypothetical protein VNH11_18600 [Pirellulales bacterium]|nr:hypothetical protein [Pirellulales bacterium]